GLPNALVYDLRYDYTDNVLVAATLGRGVWTLTNVFRDGGDKGSGAGSPGGRGLTASVDQTAALGLTNPAAQGPPVGAPTRTPVPRRKLPLFQPPTAAGSSTRQSRILNETGAIPQKWRSLSALD